ncbi:LysE family translocator [Herbaspirillum rubrisubalbicans]|nr:LysE family translocator [Herbaspirillum rubrisubalbicans]
MQVIMILPRAAAGHRPQQPSSTLGGAGMHTEFLITSLIVVASPGTGALVTLNAGLSHGTRAAMVAATGCTLGIIPHMLLAITGLATVLHSSPFCFELIQYAGVLYLLRMAWLVMKEKNLLSVERVQRPQTYYEIIQNAVLVNFLNPKLSIFFLAFLPQFIRSDDISPMWSMLSMSLVFMAMTLAIFALYGWFAAAVRDRVLRSHRAMLWLRRTFAAAFVVLGVRLALAQR